MTALPAMMAGNTELIMVRYGKLNPGLMSKKVYHCDSIMAPTSMER